MCVNVEYSNTKVYTSNNIYFMKIKRNVGMAMVNKGQKQDDYS